MKIGTLKIENFKRLRVVALDTSDKDAIVVAGRNGQGKSSILDAITVAIGGAKLAPKNPVRSGAKKAEILLEVGGWKIKRTFTADGKTPALEVTAPDGSKPGSAQSKLESLLGAGGAFILDPLEFTRKAPRDQRTILAGLAQVDLASFDQQKRAILDELRNLEAQRSTVERMAEAKTYADVPSAEVSVAELSAKLEEAQRTNSAIERAQKDIQDQRRRLEEMTAERGRLAKMIEDLDDRRVAMADEIANAESTVSDFEPVETRAIVAQIETAEETNQKVRHNQQVKKAGEELRRVSDAEDLAKAKSAEIDEAKKAALAAAGMPVEGLSFSESDVLFNDIPFSQCSASEQLRVSTAMALAMAGEIKVVLIRDASLLDGDSQQLVRDACRQAGAQLWLEVVDAEAQGDEVIVIEDGEVKGNE